MSSRRCTTSPPVAVGSVARTRAAAAVTYGAAMLVPLRVAVPERSSDRGQVDSTLSPGATRSTKGPVVENGAAASPWSTAPTPTTPG